MIKRKNECGVTKLIMCPFLWIVYPQTSARVQLKAIVEFYPADYLPEFIDVQNAIRLRSEGKTITIEQVAKDLIDIFNEFEPNGVRVKLEVLNNNSFFYVSVAASTGFLESSENTENTKKTKKTVKKNNEEDEEN